MIVVARRYGQLGNRLILFSHLIAAAEHYGVELRNPCFAEYANLFPATQSDLWCRYRPGQTTANARTQAMGDPVSPSRRMAFMKVVQLATKSLYQTGLRHWPCHVIRLRGEQECDLQSQHFQNRVRSGRPILLQGWLFRSPELVQEHRSKIVNFFRLSEEDQQPIERIIQRARQDCDVLVGVHIRRGDYANFQSGRFFYDDETYARWMRSVADQLSGTRVAFMVCTNEPLDRNAFAGLQVVSGPGTAIHDLYALAETDWMMGPPSTFTAWAEFISNRPRIELEHREMQVTIPICSNQNRFRPDKECSTAPSNRYSDTVYVGS